MCHSVEENLTRDPAKDRRYTIPIRFTLIPGRATNGRSCRRLPSSPNRNPDPPWGSLGVELPGCRLCRTGNVDLVAVAPTTRTAWTFLPTFYGLLRVRTVVRHLDIPSIFPLRSTLLRILPEGSLPMIPYDAILAPSSYSVYARHLLIVHSDHMPPFFAYSWHSSLSI